MDYNITKEDIIRMAREAGAWSQQSKNCDVEYVMSSETLERFAALVAAAERETCAKFFDDNDTNMFWGHKQPNTSEQEENNT